VGVGNVTFNKRVETIARKMMRGRKGIVNDSVVTTLRGKIVQAPFSVDNQEIPNCFSLPAQVFPRKLVSSRLKQ
jgi:hypothetical protein